MRFARSAKQVTTRKFTYPMSLPGFQEVFIPSFMPIGPKLWAPEGYSHSRSIHVLHSYLVCFAHVRFTLTKIFKKKSVSQSTRNALKRIEVQKKKITPYE